MSLAHRAGPRRRRLTPLRLLAAGVTVLLSVLVNPALDPASGQAAPTTTTTTTAPAADDACDAVTESLRLVGSSNAREALGRWASAICTTTKVVPDYSDAESKGGRDEVTPADAALIGLTSLPFTTEEQAALKAEKRGIVLVPILGGSTTCTYWDTNPGDPSRSGTRYPDLRISRRTLADLLGGSPRDGSNFSDDLAEDNADNPKYVVGPPFLTIEPWLRSGYSTTNHDLTNWFHQNPAAEADFTKSSFEDVALPFEDTPVPTNSSPQLVNDYNTMKSRMVGAQQALGIGCMDGATAKLDAKPDSPAIDRLGEAWLDNASGAFVAPTDDAVRRGLDAMTPNPDGTYSVDFETTDALAYPLPLLVYAALPTCGIDAATRSAMDAVTSYAIGAGQRDLPAGNVALPADVAATATRQLAQWRTLTAKPGPCTPEPPTTTSTTPGPSTTSAPFVEPEVGAIPGEAASGGGVISDAAFNEAAEAGPGLGGGSEELAGPVATDTAGGTAGTGGATGPGTSGGDATGPVTPLVRLVAMAKGSAALPPMAILLTGAALLLGGPILQVVGGLGRAGSLSATVGGWFRRLRP